MGGTTAVLVSDVGHGVLDLRSSGRFTYQPDAGYLGPTHSAIGPAAC